MRVLCVGMLVAAVFASPAGAAPYLYVNRCTGGCVVHSGADDARANVSSVVGVSGVFTVSEFADPSGQDWPQMLQCLREIYSPYGVVITDQLADVPAGAPFTEAIVAGQPTEVGLSSDLLAMWPESADCSALDDAISFTFASSFLAAERARNVCEVVARTTAHVYGVRSAGDTFAGSSPFPGTSACMELTSDALPCGEQFFRDAEVTCPSCCATTQSSHARLLTVLGAGRSSTPVTSTIVFPSAGATIGHDEPLAVQAGAPRGISRLELWGDGSLWTMVAGASFGSNGQADPTTYTLSLPSDILDGPHDIVVKAFDDLGTESDVTVTVTTTGGMPPRAGGGCAAGHDQTCLAALFVLVLRRRRRV